MSITFKFLTLFCIYSAFVSANSYIVFLKGDAVVLSKNKEIKVVKGMQLLVGDEVKTSSGSLVVIKINGHSTHKLSSNASLKISSLPVEFENSSLLQNPASFILKAGKILSDIVKKSDSESFKIKAHQSVMGVRGTQFYLEVNESKQVGLAVKEGTVEVSTQKDHDIVEESQLLIIDKESSFRRLDKVDPNKLATWSFNSALKINDSSLISKYNIKKSSYSKDHTRWSLFKKKKLNKLNNWKKETRKLVRSLVKSSSVRGYMDMRSFEQKRKTNDLNSHLKGVNQIINDKSKQINQRESQRQHRRDTMLKRLRKRKSKTTQSNTTPSTTTGSP